jgi:hypothetical protein
LNHEELQRLVTRTNQAVHDPKLSEAELTTQVKALHHDERVLGDAIWTSRKALPTSRTASAWFIQCMGQAGPQSYNIGDFQRLLGDLGGRSDLGAIAGSGGLIWNHSMESIAEKLGRELLLIDVNSLGPPIRQAVSFFMMRAGLISAADIEQCDVEPLFGSLVVGWEDAQDFARDWMRLAPSPEVGNFMARALSTVHWSQVEPLALALPFVHPDEAIQIVIHMEEMAHASSVIEMLDGLRDDVFLALNGRALPWYERMFGPTPESWLFGVTGVIGPPGIIGVIVALAAYQAVGHLRLFWMILVVIGTAAVVRFLIQKPVAPRFLPQDLNPARPGGGALLAAWYLRQRRLRKLKDPPTWVDLLRRGSSDQGESWRPLLIAVNDLLPPLISHAPDTEDATVDPLRLFNDVEFGPAGTRSAAHHQLIKFARAHGLEPAEALDRWFAETPFTVASGPGFIRHLESSWLTQRRISPTSFRATWAAKSLWPVSSRCLFGLYNGYNELVTVFRIDETGEFVDSDDRGIVIPGYHTVGMVEADALSKTDADRWANVFADYELVSPFEQLHATTAKIPMMLGDKALESLTDAGWIADEDAFSLRRPIWSLGITAYIEVDPPLLEAGPSQIVAFDFAEGLHFEPETVVSPLRGDSDIDRLSKCWLSELQRLVAI